jgi:hypothetical protein
MDVRGAMIAKLWRTAKREVSEVESRLRTSLQSSKRESDTRRFAVLVKTVRDLAAMADAHDAHRNNSTDAVDDDPIPQDIDEFRRKLARRMRAFVESRTGTGVPDK